MTSTTLDDVFSNDASSSSIVDADIIEAVKENIKPLQKGRRATALSAIFSTPLAQRNAVLSRQRARFRLQVTQTLEDDDDDGVADPLDAYSRFVAWTLESYPQGPSADSGIIELLEEATRQLKDDDRYKQDPRYLKLWSLYAGYVRNPAIIFAYLLANEIGTDLAQFYEEYAQVLERDGRFRNADEMYSLGVARKAEPLGRLKKRYDDFQRRMIVAPLAAPPSPPPPTRPSATATRAVLGVRSVSQPQRPPSQGGAVLSAHQPNARVQVFVDHPGEAAQSAEGNEWPDLGTRVSRTKENRVEVHRMADGPLPRSRRTTARSVSGQANRMIVPYRDSPQQGAFVPFRDGEDTTDTMPPPSEPPSSRRAASSSRLEPSRDIVPGTPKPSFTPYKDEVTEQTPLRATAMTTPASLVPRQKECVLTSEAESLRNDPFKNYDVRPDMTNLEI